MSEELQSIDELQPASDFSGSECSDQSLSADEIVAQIMAQIAEDIEAFVKRGGPDLERTHFKLIRDTGLSEEAIAEFWENAREAKAAPAKPLRRDGLSS